MSEEDDLIHYKALSGPVPPEEYEESDDIQRPDSFRDGDVSSEPDIKPKTVSPREKLKEKVKSLYAKK